MLTRVSVLAAVLPFLVFGSGAGWAAEFDHAPWDRVLKRFVTETGRVDYRALQSAPADLNQYVSQLAARSPVSRPQDFPTRESQLAYWINAYNALVMKSVIEHWPAKSVRDIGVLPYSFFWLQKFVVGGRRYTLNAIENDFLRKQFQEPRIHFVIVCAANSCPRLQREAFTPNNTGRLLEEAARFFVNEPRNLKIDPAANQVTVARIFSFYEKDFENDVRRRGISRLGHPVLDTIGLYADLKNRALLDALKKPSVRYFDYDWGINDVDVGVPRGRP